MLRIGLTGGIGSGKSTVAHVFEVLGIPVYYADEAARRLMNEDASLKEQILRNFGPSAYKDGVLNRVYLAAQVFNDKEKLDRLNAIVHPATIADGEQWMLRQTTPYALKEAALIFESGAQRQLDYVIGVHAPAPLRMLRAMKRDHSSKEKVESIISRQLDESIKMKLCDFVITNDEQQPIIPQVMELHEKLRAMSSS
ncbi:MAG TPA: dephospho-CoA kinase [Chitinophagaceae bacterium]|jgi:dephospho-CoA kinase